MNFPVEKRFIGHETEILKYFGKDHIIDNSLIDRFRSYQPFIVCFTNRSGSNMLCEDIASLKGCGHAGETALSHAVINQSRKGQLGTFSEYLLSVFDSQESEFPGIKLSIDQLLFFYESKILKECLPHCKFIFIRRRDLVSQSVSFYIADRTKQWTSQHEAQSTPPPYNKRKILRILNNVSDANSRFVKFFSITQTPYCEIVYEDFIDNREADLKRIAKHLGTSDVLDNIPTRKTLKQQKLDTKTEYKRKFCEDFTDP